MMDLGMRAIAEDFIWSYGKGKNIYQKQFLFSNVFKSLF